MPTDRRFHLGRRRAALATGAALLGGAARWPAAHAQAAPLNVHGVVWQPDYATIDPRGTWNRLGAHELLVQWTVVDGLAYVLSGDLKPALMIPDWTRIAHEAWAGEVILGLATLYDERQARRDIVQLGELAERILALPTPLNVVGWYFPVEVDPTWVRARHLAGVLDRLPKPLWISVYDNTNIGPAFLVEWLTDWLPENVGVFFQDGVGSYVRSPEAARVYADALAEALGRNRLRLIAEVVRPKVGGGFRAGTVDEIRQQLAAYDGHRVYLFEGPHYIDDALVCALTARPGLRC